MVGSRGRRGRNVREIPRSGDLLLPTIVVRYVPMNVLERDNMEERRITISVTMPPELVKSVSREAKKMGVTRSAFISLALSEFLRAINEPRKEK
jgi:hypothetical protein